MELRLYHVKPKVIRGDVEIPSDDTQTVMDKKTGDAKRDPLTQQPVVKELGTTSVQHGDSVRLEYPHIPGMKTTVLADLGDNAALWVVEAPHAVHEAVTRDTRIVWLTWEEAAAKFPALMEWIMPGAATEPSK